eukprot:scaffold89149_cov21-Tisochrysis_lutea.AAC.1
MEPCCVPTKRVEVNVYAGCQPACVHQGKSQQSAMACSAITAYGNGHHDTMGHYDTMCPSSRRDSTVHIRHILYSIVPHSVDNVDL